MPQSPFECPSCDSVIMTTGFPAGTLIKCPVCRAVVKVPADDPDDEDDERDERDEADDKPRRRNSKKGRSGRRRKKGAGSSLGLWLGLGGAAAVVVVVLVIVVGGKRGADRPDTPGNPAPGAREGGGSEAYGVERRIDTTIPLPNRDPFIFARGILSLGTSADASVIAVNSAASPRKYTLNRATGKVINEFDDPEDKVTDDRSYHGRPPIVSPDGKLVVFMSFDGPVKTIKVRDVATGNVVKTLGDARIHHFHRVAISPKGDTLYAIVHVPGEIVLAGWSLTHWQQVCHIKMPENREPPWLFPATDGKTVVTITPAWPTPQKLVHPHIDFFDVRQQTFVRSIVLTPYKNCRYAVVAPDGKTLAVSGERDGGMHSLDVWNLETAKQVCTVDIDRNLLAFQVGEFRFLPSGKLGLAASHFVAAYDPKTGDQKAIWKHDEKVGGRPITHLSFCANGEMLLILDGDVATILVVRLKE